MTDPFDPYHAWLGIGPEDQPPHHYRLLGIQPFESDSQVIADAAKGRTAQVKRFQVGEHTELAQRILKEIAAVRNCLLDPNSRAAYDCLLRAYLEEEAATSMSGPQAADTSEKAEMKGSRVGGTGVSESESLRGFRESDAKVRSRLIGIVLGGVAGTLLALAIIYLIRGRGSSTTQASVSRPSVEERAPNDAPPAFQPLVAEEPRSEEPASNVEEEITAELDESDTSLIWENPAPSANDASVQGDPEESGAGDSDEDETPDSGSEEPVETELERETELEPEPEVPQPEVSTQSKKLAPPSSAEQKAVEKRIREVLGKEFAAAGTLEQHLALAEALLKAGLETTDKSATRYVLLHLAAQRAAAIGNLSIAVRAIDEIGRDYSADTLAMKADALAEAVGSARTVRQTSAIVEETIRTGMSLIDEAVIDDNYPMAQRLSKLMAAGARRAKNLPLIRELTVREREIQRLQREFTAFQKAREVLAEEPTDREANLTAGKWYCFRKSNWDKGLPFLAKGVDRVLAELAKRESTNPKDPNERVELGDAWWDLFEKEKGAEKLKFQQRAMYWYELALPDLSGLSKMTIERKRLEALAASAHPSGSHVPGVVQEGNVALASNGTKISVRGKDVQELSSVLDGDDSGWAWARHPCEWTIVFPTTYRLQEIRFELYEHGGTFNRYAVATSPKGKEYQPLIDRSQGEWGGPQRIRFYPRSVRAIKVMGLFASPTTVFHLAGFEAYCIPPDPSPE